MGKTKTTKSAKSPCASASASTKMNKKKQTTLKIKSSVMKKKMSRSTEKKYKPQQTQTKKEDPKKPKKPPTAFFFFLEDFRKDYQDQNPDVKSMRDIGKAGGEKWKTMDYEEKIKYYDIATKKRAEFDEAVTEYNRRKETGEDQESNEDSEFDEY